MEKFYKLARISAIVIIAEIVFGEILYPLINVQWKYYYLVHKIINISIYALLIWTFSILIHNSENGSRVKKASILAIIGFGICIANDIYKYMGEYTDNNNKDKFIGADKILTFVCLKRNGEGPRTITIKGNVLLGVQLINFTAKDKNSSYYNIDDQIIFENTENKEILFYGSIACNNLNLPERLKEFGRITKRSDANYLNAPFFYYPSVMATSTPPLAVQINENMHSYNLEISGEAN